MTFLKKNDYFKITLIFLLSRIPLILFIVFKHGLSFCTIYDVLHYIDIAKNGYTSDLLYAFFPLFPLTIKLFHFIIPSYKICALLLGNIFSFLSVLVLYNLIKDYNNKFLIIISFIFSPILIFTSIGYTESLYLLLTILSFYLYKHKKYFICGIFLGLSMLARNSGIILLGAIGLDMLYNWYKKKIHFKDLVILSIPAFSIGFLYSIYLYYVTNDFFKYISVQYTEWDKEKCNLITLLIKDFQYFIKNKNIFIVLLENWLFYFIGLILGIKFIKKDLVLSIYLIVSLLLFTTVYRSSVWLSLPSISLFRYVLSLFPIYLNDDTKYCKIITCLFFIFSIMNIMLIFYRGFFIA